MPFLRELGEGERCPESPLTKPAGQPTSWPLAQLHLVACTEATCLLQPWRPPSRLYLQVSALPRVAHLRGVCLKPLTRIPRQAWPQFPVGNSTSEPDRGLKEHSHKVRPVSVQDSAEGQAIAERGGHVGDAHVPVALALLPAPFLQGLDGGHAGGRTGWRLEELATGPAWAGDAEEARTRRPPAGLEEESVGRPAPHTEAASEAAGPAPRRPRLLRPAPIRSRPLEAGPTSSKLHTDSLFRPHRPSLVRPHPRPTKTRPHKTTPSLSWDLENRGPVLWASAPALAFSHDSQQRRRGFLFLFSLRPGPL